MFFNAVFSDLSTSAVFSKAKKSLQNDVFLDLSTGALFSSDFSHFGDFGGLGSSWAVSGSRFLGFVDRCSVFEGPWERESLGELGGVWGSLGELVGALELPNRLGERTRTFG